MKMTFLTNKIKLDGYEKSIDNLVGDREKKILLYGAGKAFEEFIKAFPQFLKLNIIAVADKKFIKTGKFKGIKTIPPSEIPNMDFDIVLVTLLYAKPIVRFLKEDLHIEKEIQVMAGVDDEQERSFMNYLEGLNFEKTLAKMSKKLKNKKIMLYGAGSFFEAIKKHYDISNLNIIGIADKKYETNKDEKEFLGYKTFAPGDIAKENPDYVLVSTLKFVNIVDFLACELLKNTKIKVRPLVTLPFFKLIKEIWNS